MLLDSDLMAVTSLCKGAESEVQANLFSRIPELILLLHS